MTSSTIWCATFFILRSQVASYLPLLNTSCCDDHLLTLSFRSLKYPAVMLSLCAPLPYLPRLMWFWCFQFFSATKRSMIIVVVSFWLSQFGIRLLIWFRFVWLNCKFLMFFVPAFIALTYCHSTTFLRVCQICLTIFTRYLRLKNRCHRPFCRLLNRFHTE